MTIPAILFEEQPGDNRGAERIRIRFGVSWLDHEPGARELTILDVSQTGFLVETDQPLLAKTSLIVELPNAVCKVCRIVWSSGPFRGAVFSEPLSDIELQELVFEVRDPFRRLKKVYQFDQGSDRDLPKKLSSDDGEVSEDEKLPFATRLKIILGSAALLWSAIGSVAWVAVSAA